MASDRRATMSVWESQGWRRVSRCAARCVSASAQAARTCRPRLTTSCRTMGVSLVCALSALAYFAYGCLTRSLRRTSPPASSGGGASSSPATRRATGSPGVCRICSTTTTPSTSREPSDRAARASSAAMRTVGTSPSTPRTSSAARWGDSSSGSTASLATTRCSSSIPRAGTRSRASTRSSLGRLFAAIFASGRSSSPFRQSRTRRVAFPSCHSGR
jgi:hypothetical protein